MLHKIIHTDRSCLFELFLVDVDIDIDLDESYMSDVEKEEEVKEQKQSVTSHLETPPGLNLFTRFGPDPDNRSYGFKHFTLGK